MVLYIFLVSLLTFGFSLYGSCDQNTNYAIGCDIETASCDSDKLEQHRQAVDTRATHNMSQKLDLLKNVLEKTASSYTSGDKSSETGDEYKIAPRQNFDLSSLRYCDKDQVSKNSIAKHAYIKANKAQLDRNLQKKFSLLAWMRCYPSESKVFDPSKK
jgi:hypothetical protein